MAENENLGTSVEKAHKELTFREKVADGINAIPPILGCTIASYLIDVPGCMSGVSEAMQPGLNVDVHIAAGSGLYGGYTKNGNRKMASLVTLALSFTPEVVMLLQDGDLNRIGSVAGTKLLGYGLGYIIGHFVG